MRVSVGQIAEAVGGRIVPPADCDAAAAAARQLSNVAGLGDAGPDDLSFLANPKYQPLLATTRAGAVLVAQPQALASGPVQIVVANPDWCLAQLVEAFGPKPPAPPIGIHPSAVIGERVRIGTGVRIGAHATIGEGAELGDGVVLHPNATVGAFCRLGDGCVLFPHASLRERCVLGRRVVVHNGAVVGSDGFGYATVDGVHRKIPQVGIVVVEDDVEIGANTAIDRARFGRTRIGQGSKLDNLVQIAHNVEVGAHSILVAQCGIAGSSKLGRNNIVAGQSGLAGHLTLGDRVTVTGRSGVSKNLPDGVTVRGSPAQDFKEQLGLEIAVRKLPAALERIRRLEARLAALEGGKPAEDA
jgi:UDP-3-O-[3-hydroxymyristoyl] glucosamine N-acyltransferase